MQPDLTRYEATIDTVTYADNTAETTNPDALKRELDARKNAAETIQATNQAIHAALANPADQSPHETAKKEIENLQKKWQASGHVFHRGVPGRVVSELDEAPNAATHLGQTLPDYLNNLIARNQKQAALLLEHAAPKIIGGAK